MKRFLYIGIIFFFSTVTTLNAEPFEGTIELVKHTYYDTFYYEFHVKNDFVRIDMYNKDSAHLSSLLVNLNKRQVFAINNERKLFKELSVREKPPQLNEKDYRVLKTENTKVIDGYLCYQWRVRNKDKNSEIVYWVTKNGFYFYDDLIDILNDVDNISDFYKQITNNDGFLPILVVERTLVRYEKERMQVNNISHTSLSESIFSIPTDYKKFEN